MAKVNILTVPEVQAALNGLVGLLNQLYTAQETVKANLQHKLLELSDDLDGKLDEVAELKRRNDALEAEVAELKRRNTELEGLTVEAETVAELLSAAFGKTVPWA